MNTGNIHIGAEKAKVNRASNTVASKTLFEKINFFVEDSMTKITIKEKMLFYRMFSSLVNAGISVTKALDIVSQQIDNPKFKRIVKHLAREAESGKALSDAMSHYPEQFPMQVRGMVESGEISGKLNTICNQIAIDTENANTLVKKVKGALTYPVVVIFVVVAVITIVMIFVVPKLSELFATAGEDLPALTQGLISTSAFMTSTTFGIPNIFVVFASCFAGFRLFITFISTTFGRMWWHKLLLWLPIIGKIIQKIALARFSRNLHNLLAAGISITKTLRINAESIGNEVYKQKILLVAEDVERGLQIHQSIEGSDLFPPLVTHMIAVGEKIAQLDKLGAKIAEFYEEEVNDTMDNISKIMEPVILVFVAVIVGVIAIAIMQPIMSIADLASQG
jgi:type IV pilus assembly protein PilC